MQVPVRGPRRDPVTHAAFRRQVWAQIYAPLAVGGLVLAALAAALWSGRGADASAWADGASILLMLPILVASVIPLALAAAAIYVIRIVLRRIPGPALRLQTAARELSRRADRAAGLVLRPFVVASGARAGLARGLRRLASILSTQD